MQERGCAALENLSRASRNRGFLEAGVVVEHSSEDLAALPLSDSAFIALLAAAQHPAPKVQARARRAVDRLGQRGPACQLAHAYPSS